jgi:type I restriction enzyme S subunit
VSELPPGWAGLRLGEIASFEMGQAPPGSASNFEGRGSVFVKAGEFGSRRPVVREWTTDPKKFATADDDLVCVVGATAGKLNLGIDCAIGRSVAAIRPTPAISQLLLYFQLLTRVAELRAGSTGSAQGVISRDMLASLDVVLPPLLEQERIANKLDALLARVDACRGRLDRVPTILKRFRQAVLAAATIGELTKEWREGSANEPTASDLLHRIAEERERRSLSSASRSIESEAIDVPVLRLPETWTWCRVGQIADVRLGGTPSRREETYWNGDIPWVSSGEVANSRIANTSEKITRLGLENSNAKLYPRGTVLIAMIGEGKTRGQSALLEIDATTNQNAAGIVFETDGIEPEYVWYWALGEYERNRSVGRGGNQPALNGAKVRALPLPLPPTSEQRAIVERVRTLFALADELDRRLDAASSVSERLAPALLSKAFRGALVPQDPNDEPVSELLARIRSGRGLPGEAGKPKRGSGTRSPRAKAKVETNMLTPKDLAPTHLTAILKERGALTAEALWSASQLEIDDFYDQLKDEEARGLLKETRGDAASAPRLLEAAA